MALRINKDTHFVDATMVDGTCKCVLFQGTVIEAGAWRDESNLLREQLSPLFPDTNNKKTILV